jgi:hypothetical protein
MAERSKGVPEKGINSKRVSIDCLRIKEFYVERWPSGRRASPKRG